MHTMSEDILEQQYSGLFPVLKRCEEEVRAIISGLVGSMGGGAYRPEHRIVWEQTHGQTLPSTWVVHHLNGVKDDNRPENLAAMPRHEHHTHPRKALVPYEERIQELEQRLASFSEP